MRATHSLTQVKGLIQDRRYRVAIVASNDAGALGFEEADILDCVLGLTDGHCYKTMESTSRPGTFQDVYHVIYCGEEPGAMDTIERCPECGAEAGLVNEQREVRLGSRVVAIEDEFMRCSSCGEAYYLPGGMERAQRLAAEKVRSEEGLMRPEEIRSLRESLGLSQAQLENLLNVGPKTVVRWERGTVFQSGAVNTLLKVLLARPEVLTVMSDANQVELPALAIRRAAKNG